MHSLSEYIKIVANTISNNGSDSSIVFDPSVSPALIYLYNIMKRYLILTKSKTNIISPFFINSKSDDLGKSYITMKFNKDLDLDAFHQAIEDEELSQMITVETYASSINVEITNGANSID